MSGFLLSAHADQDLEEIESYLETLPDKPAVQVGTILFRTLTGLGEDPYLGIAHSLLTRTVGMEVRSRLAHPYRTYYRIGTTFPEILAILHTARNVQTILSQRFQ